MNTYTKLYAVMLLSIVGTLCYARNRVNLWNHRKDSKIIVEIVTNKETKEKKVGKQRGAKANKEDIKFQGDAQSIRVRDKDDVVFLTVKAEDIQEINKKLDNGKRPRIQVYEDSYKVVFK